jgi:hypothetical protein
LTSNTRVKPSWEQLLKLPHHTKPLKLAVTSNPSIEEEDDAGASSENLPDLGGNYENLPHLLPSGDFSMISQGRRPQCTHAAQDDHGGATTTPRFTNQLIK